MWQYKLLGTMNILLTIFFLYFLLFFSYSTFLFDSLTRQINSILQLIIIFGSAFLNAFSAKRLFTARKNERQFSFSLLLTVSTIVWFILYFIGFFFASNIFFPLFSMCAIGTIFWYAKKFSVKIALVICFVTLVSSLLTILFAFEEDYCWSKGTAADPNGKIIIATKEDEASLKSYNVKAGSEIGLAFKTHMRCHDTFDYFSAVKEKYLFRK